MVASVNEMLSESARSQAIRTKIGYKLPEGDLKTFFEEFDQENFADAEEDEEDQYYYDEYDYYDFEEENGGNNIVIISDLKKGGKKDYKKPFEDYGGDDVLIMSDLKKSGKRTTRNRLGTTGTCFRVTGQLRRHLLVFRQSRIIHRSRK
jgi:hypothetical protein